MSRETNIASLNNLAAFLSSFEEAVGIPAGQPWEPALLRLRLRLTDEETTELCQALTACVRAPAAVGISEPMKQAVAKEVADVIITAFSTARVLGINIGAALQEIVECNLSKRLDDGTFMRDDGGKILKGPNYVKPTLEGVV